MKTDTRRLIKPKYFFIFYYFGFYVLLFINIKCCIL